MTWWRIEIETGEEGGGPVPETDWKTEVDMTTRDPRVASAALFAVVDGLDTVAVTADSAMNGLVSGLRKEIGELKVIRDQLAEDRDVLKIQLAEAHRAAVVRTGGKAPSAPLSRPVSAETPSRAPEAVQELAGPQNRSEGAGAILRVVEAARAWRNHLACDVRGGPGVSDLTADLLDALDALGDTPASVIPGTNWMTMARGIGWRDGVRWAAAEADSRTATNHRWTSGEPGAGLAGLEDLQEITDHLRLCAADPKRPTNLGRDRAPKGRL